MNTNHTRDLFQLQSELVDSKVEIAVSKAIDRVIAQINDFKIEVHNDIHGLRRDMDKKFSLLEASILPRITAVETTLTFIKDTQAFIKNTQQDTLNQIKTKFIEYTFKAAWVVSAASLSYVLIHYFSVIR